MSRPRPQQPPRPRPVRSTECSSQSPAATPAAMRGGCGGAACATRPPPPWRVRRPLARPGGAHPGPGPDAGAAVPAARPTPGGSGAVVIEPTILDTLRPADCEAELTPARDDRTDGRVATAPRPS